jgi:hypothetical protein
VFVTPKAFVIEIVATIENPAANPVAESTKLLGLPPNAEG